MAFIKPIGISLVSSVVRVFPLQPKTERNSHITAFLLKKYSTQTGQTGFFMINILISVDGIKGLK